MPPTRSVPGVDSDLLLAAACLFAGLGLGLTGLSVVAELKCLSCFEPLAAAATGLPMLAGAGLTTVGGWLFGRGR
jgi:hypothetical protein